MNTLYIPNERALSAALIPWLYDNVGEQPEAWWWWEGSKGFFLGFKHAQDAVACKLKFAL